MANSIDLGPHFSRGEYWLLETVVNSALPLGWLVARNLGEVLNKPPHGLNRDQLSVALHHLFASGLIIAHEAMNEDKRFILTSEQIKVCLGEQHSPHPILYSLTADGGRQWEAFAAPNWNRYVDASYIPNGDQETEQGELACGDRRLAERYLRGLHYAGVDIDLTTITWEELQPWQATYWKELAVGYRARFTCRRDNGLNWDSMPLSYYWIYESRWYQWK